MLLMLVELMGNQEGTVYTLGADGEVIFGKGGVLVSGCPCAGPVGHSRIHGAKVTGCIGPGWSCAGPYGHSIDACGIIHRW